MPHTLVARGGREGKEEEELTMRENVEREKKKKKMGRKEWGKPSEQEKHRKKLSC